MEPRPPSSVASVPGSRFEPFTPRVLALLFGLVLAALLVGNASTSLWDQDEAAYAGFARQMLATGDWAVPDFSWSEPHRKPPLLFWSIAASFRLLGESEFALRVPTVLATLLTLFSLAFLGRPIFGGRAALVGAVALGSSLFVPNLAKVAVTDALLLLFQTVAVLSMYRAITTPAWRWTALFWSAVALGLLVKGPPILVLTGGLGVFLLVFHPGRWKLLRLHPWFFLPLSLVPLLWWGYIAWERTDGTLIRWMLDWYVLRRASNPVFGQTGPPGYFLLSFALLFFPWALFLPSAAVRLKRSWRDPTSIFLMGWLLFGWVFYELMASKLPTYALGAYPALALLVGREIGELAKSEPWSFRSIRWSTNAAVALAAVLTAGLIGAAAWFFGVAGALGAGLAGSCLLVATLLSRRSLRTGEVMAAVRTLAVGSLVFLIATWTLVLPRVETMRALGPQLAASVERLAPTDAPIVFARNFRLPSLPFYVGRANPRQVTATSVAELASRVDDEDAQVFVFDEKGFESVRPALPETVQVHPVAGWNLDKVQPVTWWIVVKPATRSAQSADL